MGATVLALLFAVFFFFNDTATTEIYTLSLHDALPISLEFGMKLARDKVRMIRQFNHFDERRIRRKSGEARSEEHTSELQSRQYLVCRLLLEKKKTEVSIWAAAVSLGRLYCVDCRRNVP